MLRSRRLMAGLMGLVLVVAACGDDEPAATTTAAPAATSTSSAPGTTTAVTEAPAATTTTEATTTTTTEAPPPEPPAGSMLITNEDGVYVGTLDGVVSQIIDADPGVVGGMIDFAIDDTRGGVVVHPNRSPWTDLGTDSIVYWVPEGAGSLQELLVPAADQGLSLEDVVAEGDAVGVYYSRRSGDLPDTATQTLRRFDLDDKGVVEVAVVGGWESGAGPISVGGASTVRNAGGEGWNFIIFSDLAGTTFESPANPMPDGEFDCVPDCFYYADLSPDGTQVAFGRLAKNAGGFNAIPEIEVRDVGTGALVMSVALPTLSAPGFIESIDLSATHVLINIVEEGSEYPVARIVDIASGGLTTYMAPANGVARFLRSVPALDGVVTWP